jgi:hypothetical protein
LTEKLIKIGAKVVSHGRYVSVPAPLLKSCQAGKICPET